VAPLRVRLGRRQFREPDVVFMLKEHGNRIGEQFWKGADLVMEVVSDDPESRDRDLVLKRREYARAGIAEYWIVDPRERAITVLRLSGKHYTVHGVFPKGTMASSHLLAGFTVEVDNAFAQCLQLGRAAKGRRKPRQPKA
jgi:Uma2 family endonuclease